MWTAEYFAVDDDLYQGCWQNNCNAFAMLWVKFVQYVFMVRNCSLACHHMPETCTQSKGFWFELVFLH